MIGVLPKSLNVNGRKIDINSDYRVCLTIMEAFNDPELNDYEKWQVALRLLYKEKIQVEEMQAACDQAAFFLNCGNKIKPNTRRPLYDWNEDEQYIFAGLNKTYGGSIRAVEYYHWWDFIACFMEIGESSFSTIVGIRDKRARGKKLEKHEQQFANENPSLFTSNADDKLMELIEQTENKYKDS